MLDTIFQIFGTLLYLTTIVICGYLAGTIMYQLYELSIGVM